ENRADRSRSPFTLREAVEAFGCPSDERKGPGTRSPAPRASASAATARLSAAAPRTGSRPHADSRTNAAATAPPGAPSARQGRSSARRLTVRVSVSDAHGLVDPGGGLPGVVFTVVDRGRVLRQVVHPLAGGLLGGFLLGSGACGPPARNGPT